MNHDADNTHIKTSLGLKLLFYILETVIIILSAFIVGSITALLSISLPPILIKGIIELHKDYSVISYGKISSKVIDWIISRKLLIIGVSLFTLSVLPVISGLFIDYPRNGLDGFRDLDLSSMLKYCFSYNYTGAITALSAYALFIRLNAKYRAEKWLLVDENAVNFCLLIAMLVMLTMQLPFQENSVEKYSLSNYYQLFNCLSLFFNLFFSLCAIIKICAMLNPKEKTNIIHLELIDIMLLFASHSFPLCMIYLGKISIIWLSPIFLLVIYFLLCSKRLTTKRKHFSLLLVAVATLHCFLGLRSVSDGNKWQVWLTTVLYLIILIFQHFSGSEDDVKKSAVELNAGLVKRNFCLFLFATIPIALVIGGNMLFHKMEIQVNLPINAYYSFDLTYPVYKVIDDEATVHFCPGIDGEKELHGTVDRKLALDKYVSISDIKWIDGEVWGKNPFDERWFNLRHLREVSYNTWNDTTIPRPGEYRIIGTGILRNEPIDNDDNIIYRLPENEGISIETWFYNSRGNLWGRLKDSDEYIYVGNVEKIQ